MKHEFKVILGPTSMETKVFIDDKPVGLIQEIKFVANVETGKTDTELTFPDLGACKTATLSSGLVHDLESTLELLKEIPHVKVVLKPIW